MATNPILAVAKKEYLDGLRGRWTIVMTAIFVLLMLIFAYVAVDVPAEEPVRQMFLTGGLLLRGILIPLLAVMLGYATIVGEIEAGSLHSLVAMPVLRYEVVYGKFFGLLAVLATSLAVGFAAGAAYVFTQGTGGDPQRLLVFLGGVIVLSALFLSLAMAISAVASTRRAAMGASVFAWFLFSILWFLILGLVVGALLKLTGAGTASPFAKHLFFGGMFANPAMLATIVLESILGSDAILGVIPWPIAPAYLNEYSALSALLRWIGGLLVFAEWRFAKRDL
ncbi:MAG: ABC transporter permease [Methanobacteriota archaeon]